MFCANACSSHSARLTKITGVAQSGVQQASVSQAGLVKSGGQVMQTFYPKSHHAAFTFLSNRVVRIVIALAE